MTELTRAVVVDDADSRIRYSGSWSTASGSTNNFDSKGNFGDVYLNTLHTTSTSSSSVSFTFTGNVAEIFGTTDLSVDEAGKSDPDWDCFVDGAISADAKRPAFPYTENNWRFCAFTGLSAGQHTIQLTVRTRGRPFYIDYIRYRPTSEVENETMFITRDDADLVYNKKWGSLAQVAYFTTETGGSVSFPFIGTRLSLWSMVPTELPHGASDATYSIDGGSDVPFTIPELKGTISEYDRRIFETPQLSAGRHTITITYRSGTQSTPLALGNLLISGGTNRRAIAPPTNPGSGGGDNENSGGGNTGGGTGGSTGSGGGESGNNNGNGNGDSTNSGGNGGSSSGGGPNIGNSGDGGSNGGGNGGTGYVNGGSNQGDNTSNSGNKDSSNSGSPAPNNTIYIRPSDTAKGTGDNSTVDQQNLVGTTSTTPTGAIVGGVLGGLALILVGLAILFFLRQRRRKQRLDDAFNPASLTLPSQHTPEMVHYAASRTQHQPYSDIAYTTSNHGSSAYSGMAGHQRGLSASNTTLDGQSIEPFHVDQCAQNPFENPPPPMYSK